jgi:cupin 2 domain-containing protein
MKANNLFQAIPDSLPVELAETLVGSSHVRIERIISRQHASLPGFWYDQDWNEWVLLLTGTAGLRIEGFEDVLTLKPGDHLLLSAHQRHRVEWTDPQTDTIWLAVHFPPSARY